MKYVLTRLGKFDDQGVALVSDYRPEGGRFSRDSVMPDMKTPTGKPVTGGQFVIQKTDNPGGDPGLACDEPDRFDEYVFEFLLRGVATDVYEIAHWLARRIAAGKKIPTIQSGASVYIEPGSFVAPRKGAARQDIGAHASATNVGRTTEINEIFIGPPR